MVPVNIEASGAPIAPTPNADGTYSSAITIGIEELREVIMLKGKIWGPAETTDLHPTETKLAAVSNLFPAVPFAKVRVSDIAKRLTYRSSAPPAAQRTWPAKLGLPADSFSLDWTLLYANTHNKITTPKDRDVFLKLIFFWEDYFVSFWIIYFAPLLICPDVIMELVVWISCFLHLIKHSQYFVWINQLTLVRVLILKPSFK